MKGGSEAQRKERRKGERKKRKGNEMQEKRNKEGWERKRRKRTVFEPAGLELGYVMLQARRIRPIFFSSFLENGIVK